MLWKISLKPHLFGGSILTYKNLFGDHELRVTVKLNRPPLPLHRSLYESFPRGMRTGAL